MASQVRNVAPFINKEFTVTSEWWTPRWGTIHKGLDISTGSNDPVYSIVQNGVVNQVWYNDVDLGNALVIKSLTNGYATLYMHLDSLNVSLGDIVPYLSQVGIEGTTGDSTGIHLHVEMQDMTNLNTWLWTMNKSDYLDPTEYMGIDNVLYSTWIYDGTPHPTPKRIKSHFPFVLYSRKKYY